MSSRGGVGETARVEVPDGGQLRFSSPTLASAQEALGFSDLSAAMEPAMARR